VKRVRVFSKLMRRTKKNESDQPSLFYICDKSSHFPQFQADRNADPNFAVERVAGLLAMQCLIHGANPDNFSILVPAEKTLANELVSRAKLLLEEGRTVSAPASLSSRQKEILQSVIRNRANKEIASQLNITVRTVKFHVSTLLNKFGVENRMELARKAMTVLPPSASESLDLEESPGASKPEQRVFRDADLNRMRIVHKATPAPFRDPELSN
jgi:DNA-binding CsgD family transcriptional regulator